jgi:hypothetical protein
LDDHHTIRLNNQPPLGGVAQIDRDVDIGDRAKRRRQGERRCIGPGGGNGAFEVDNPLGIFRFRLAGAERRVGPSVGQRKQLESSRLREEPRTLERREALGIAEHSALGLDGHHTSGQNLQPPVRGVAQIDRDVDRVHRANPPGQHKGLRIGSGGGNGALEVHRPVDQLDCGVAGSEYGVGPAVDQRQRRCGATAQHERRAVERREALRVAERSAFGLDGHDTAGLND